jgi:hypothetical protein
VKSLPYIQEACQIIYRWFFTHSSMLIDHQVEEGTHLELTAGGMNTVIDTLEQAGALEIEIWLWHVPCPHGTAHARKILWSALQGAALPLLTS